MGRISLALVSAVLLLACQEASAQVCKPVAERTGEVGCWIIAHQSVGNLNKPETYWHLDVYATRSEAEAAKAAGSAVLESLGRMWLLTIADKGWRPSGGERIAEIGPLPITAGQSYTAQYMEAIFTPGMTAPAHTHAGPEAWYTQAGETCLETPDGKQIGRAGGPPVIIPGGPPMHLTATGTEQRRSLVLILHDSLKGRDCARTRLGPQRFVQDLVLDPTSRVIARFRNVSRRRVTSDIGTKRTS
jgi:quercetin dioxygenase-like cupin family protein